MDPSFIIPSLRAVDSLSNLVSNLSSDQPRQGTVRIDTAHHETHLQDHLAYVNDWASNVSIKGTQRLLEQISIDVHAQPGQARRAKEDLDNIAPIDTLISGTTSVFLGGPGAGKTTTLKMLATHLFTATSGHVSDDLSFPIVLRLRSLPSKQSISEAILQAIGLRVVIEGFYDSFDSSYNPSDHPYVSQVIENICAGYLREMNVAILLDGLDEVRHEQYRRFVSELTRLTATMGNSCIITTCRHGAYTVPIENAIVYSLKPFTHQQSVDFISKWFLDEDKTNDLIRSISESPYSELLYTPLHAANLCSVYERYGALPNEHVLIYSMIIDSRLRDWDEQRGVIRFARFSGLTQDRRKQFLSQLAYEMARVGSSLSFTILDASDALWEMSDIWDIEKSDPRELLEDLEAATGIIQLVHFDEYEFIHKTIQEFLVADHIARAPTLRQDASTIIELPDACALSIALSVDRASFSFALWDTVRTISRGRLSKFSGQFLNRIINEKLKINTSVLGGWSLLSFISCSLQRLQFFQDQEQVSTLREEPFFATVLNNDESIHKLFYSPLSLAIGYLRDSPFNEENLASIDVQKFYPEHIGRRTSEHWIDISNTIPDAGTAVIVPDEIILPKTLVEALT